MVGGAAVEEEGTVEVDGVDMVKEATSSTSSSIREEEDGAGGLSILSPSSMTPILLPDSSEVEVGEGTNKLQLNKALETRIIKIMVTNNTEGVTNNKEGVTNNKEAVINNKEGVIKEEGIMIREEVEEGVEAGEVEGEVEEEEGKYAMVRLQQYVFIIFDLYKNKYMNKDLSSSAEDLIS